MGRVGSLRVLLVEAAGRTSNEWELFGAMRDAHLTVVSNRSGWGADEEIVLPTVSPPFVSTYEAWTAAPAWLRGLGRVPWERYDVVVSLELFSFGSAQASHFARAHRIPHALFVAETLANSPLYRVPPWRNIARQMRDRVDLFICATPSARDHLVQLGCPRDRCQVVALGVDTGMFRPAAHLEPSPTVLFVGMLRADRGADKGVLDLVEACRRLWKEDVPDLRLQLVGQGHLRPRLNAMAKTSPFLSLLGHIDRTAVAQLMRESRLLALPSKRTMKWEEQFGFVLVEAMASGLPVVATRSGAIPEVVPNWNPLVAEGDIDALSEAIRGSLSESGEAQGARNRRHAVEHFDLDAQAAVLRSALHRAVIARPPA